MPIAGDVALLIVGFGVVDRRRIPRFEVVGLGAPCLDTNTGT